ncbi:MAG TPA: 4Fe-4S dicluster domain-containing protein [Clostridia bacterium]|jgi:ferredoxin like protein|nr:4Fe-4S dicluster domain-containing protein [Clostridia bacterium]
MTKFKIDSSDPLSSTTIKADSKSHISIKNRALCLKCENKPCTYFCPSRVYSWENNAIHINYKRCIECGACPFGCPSENIYWQFPRGEFGVCYKK